MLHPLAALKESFVHSSCKYSCLPWLFSIPTLDIQTVLQRLTWQSYISKVNRLSTCWLTTLHTATFQMLTISPVVLGAKHLIYVYPIYPMDDDLEPSNQ